MNSGRPSRPASRLARRHRRERLFRSGGVLALGVALGFLGLILVTLLGQGVSAFTQTRIDLPVRYAPERLGVDAGAAGFERGNFDALVLDALTDALGIADADRGTRRELRQLVSIDAAFVLRERLESEPSLLAQRVDIGVPAAANVDMLVKGQLSRETEPSRRPLSDRQIRWVDRLAADGRLERRFNTALFTNGDSREPELAGIRGALKGSLLMLVVTIALAFPVGVAAAIYLEELAPRNRWTTIVEVSINNLAAVPSIVFGLLGLAVLIDGFGLPRSAPVVGGIVLALLTLPVIIIASRAAIRNVPVSLREAALSLGASRLQVVFHHVMPLAMPGILTGTILGVGRALGETAPLLMIGMVAFIVDVPESFSDPATALPVQIYLWAESPERAFAERTSAAILILLALLLALNILATLVRRSVERNR
ncbi:MAG: phosphate ABC transporter permease PstA [Woeseiaceae bacterium]|jgi:phosphate transport system permease protein|nr:phosphate ABC transporter permease PstA [Woeseiaceae bacterium]